jgi:hypothetical protein
MWRQSSSMCRVLYVRICMKKRLHKNAFRENRNLNIYILFYIIYFVPFHTKFEIYLHFILTIHFWLHFYQRLFFWQCPFWIGSWGAGVRWGRLAWPLTSLFKNAWWILASHCNRKIFYRRFTSQFSIPK